MIQAIIISDKYKFVQELIKVLNNENINSISDDYKNVIKLLDSKNCNVILFDETQPNSNTNTIIGGNDISEIRKRVLYELLNLGYDSKYNGTQYLTDAIVEVYIHKDNLSSNLQRSIFPIIANRYNKSVQNIKNSIDNATIYMYRECNIEKLKEYFNLQSDAKPSIKKVIFTVVNKI